ncbi:MAG: transcription antitermination factor NusB [Myxococcota bacterium]
MSGHASRAASRQVALQVLYAADLAASRAVGEDFDPVAAGADAFEAVAGNFDLPEGARAFAKELVFGVMERRVELDALLAEHARNWRVDRMAAVDRNVLRIAVYELLATETATSVVIDQAIELARRFGDDPSPAFVNGVIDAVAGSVVRPESSAGGAA